MRLPGVAWGVLVALTLVLLTPAVALAEQENFYLGPDGVPRGQLMLNPLGGEMPNYDRGRGVEPGLLLQKSTLGLAEEDAARYQQWQMDLSGQRLVGYPSMVLWSAADGFEGGRQGVFTIYLLDCDASGGDCDRLGLKAGAMDSGEGGTWIETIVDFPEIDHTFGQGRTLAVRVVVPSTSETDLMFAYGYTAQRSRLTIHSEMPEWVTDAAVSPAPADYGATSPIASASGDEPASAPAAAAAETPAPTEAVAVEAPATTSFWPWLITFAVSTSALVALGFVLMSSLARSGRHQHPGATRLEEGGQSRRISVSAP
jgi:hypothetical protein